MSRLRSIDPQAATGRTRELLDAVRQKFGRVPNIRRLLANSPAALEGYLSFGKALAGGRLDPLPPALKGARDARRANSRAVASAAATTADGSAPSGCANDYTSW